MGELETLDYSYLDGEGDSARFIGKDKTVITVSAESRIY